MCVVMLTSLFDMKNDQVLQDNKVSLNVLSSILCHVKVCAMIWCGVVDQKKFGPCFDFDRIVI